MKIKVKELRNLSDEDLIHKEKDIKRDLFDINNQRSLARVEKPAAARQLRRQLAQVLTILNERKNHGKKK
jgi:large subunit ribosomal protein L29